MKIATRISCGFGIVILLVIISTAFQVITGQKFQSAVLDLSAIKFRAVLNTLDLMRNLERVEEHARHFFVTRSSEDAASLKDVCDEFTSCLEQITGTESQGKEAAELGRLNRFWKTFSGNLASIPAADTSASTGMPEDMQESLGQLRTQIQTVYQMTRNSIVEGADRSRQSAQKAVMLLVWVGVLILVLCVLAGLLATGSVVVPLHNLIQDTRALAEGKSYYRLDTSRSDEISQLAKAINALSQKITHETAQGADTTPAPPKSCTQEAPSSVSRIEEL